MNPIRPHDLVRLRHTPNWIGIVVDLIENDLALVRRGRWLCWVPLDFLEIVPGQFERLRA